MCLEYTLKKHKDHKKCSGKRSRICSVYIDTKVTNNTKSFPDHYNAISNERVPSVTKSYTDSGCFSDSLSNNLSFPRPLKY